MTVLSDDPVLRLKTGAATRRVRLLDYLDADGEEAAAKQAIAWIKSLRHARVGGLAFRERFTYKEDSLWWFAELYLHKTRTVLSIFRTLQAASALVERDTPESLQLERGGDVVRLVMPQLARACGIGYEGPPVPEPSRFRLLQMEARSTALMAAALASPARPWRQPATAGTRIAAFVHRAFWRADAADSSGEAYIGPVLRTLEQRVAPGAIQYIGVGPTRNFRARRWWQHSTVTSRVVRPIEQLVPRTALGGASGIWAARNAIRLALSSSEDVRSASIIGRCDCWPLVADELAGVALLQFPWSARAMDEAGAALDLLQPAVAVTYAEAGGWGRALALEARRRQIPLVGLQHGFIYRHWLNYLHEPDEIEPLGPPSQDRGFPRPALTLVFDQYAATHLVEAGRFPREAIAVTGSPRLDELADAFRRLTEQDLDAVRRSCGAESTRALVLLVTKYSEAAPFLPALVEAVAAMPDVQLAIKTHPAEMAGAYEAGARNRQNVRVLPAAEPLAPLLRASQVVVTVNSTVALDAMALGVPSLSIGLPNNLTPFVDAGAIAGARDADIGPALRRLLYDGEFRQQFCSASRTIAERFGMQPDGRAAERQAAAILGVARPEP